MLSNDVLKEKVVKKTGKTPGKKNNPEYELRMTSIPVENINMENAISREQIRKKAKEMLDKKTKEPEESNKILMDPQLVTLMFNTALQTIDLCNELLIKQQETLDRQDGIIQMLAAIMSGKDN